MKFPTEKTGLRKAGFNSSLLIARPKLSSKSYAGRADCSALPFMIISIIYSKEMQPLQTFAVAIYLVPPKL